ncbi:universal stress protein PHOS32-like [Humulus lupulus]|uniref:universal stress protein PHOS32-like n=1 Tax=Humulus lupulus TaxID=3486 RepID=UPI002B415475|nr:universal stress protein PHOS32-like [Humulus lupulus]
MGRTGPKLPSFCLNRIRPLVRVRSPPTQQKFQVNSLKAAQKLDEGPNGIVKDEKTTETGIKPSSGIGRKIMVVVDSSFEAKVALQWALSHSMPNQDKLVLLHVIKPISRKGTGTGEQLSKEKAPKAFELVYSLKNMCQSKKAEVEIDVSVIEGKEKGPRILEEAKKQSVDLLVLGQKKRSTTWRLLMMWSAGHRAGGGVGGGVVEYCIQNATCMALAVRRKNRRVGGYLITTKRHKDFWLLA